jgi:putative zinc finger protein
MDCRRIEQLLPLYVESDLEPDTARVVTSHLKMCERCGALCRQYEQSQQWLHSHATPEFDGAFFDDLRRGVIGEIERQKARPAYFQLLINPLSRNWAAQAAALLLVIMSAVAVYLNSGETTDPVGTGEVIADKAPTDNNPPPRQTDKVPLQYLPTPLKAPVGNPARADRVKAREIDLPDPSPLLISEILRLAMPDVIAEESATAEGELATIESLAGSGALPDIEVETINWKPETRNPGPAGLLRIEIQTANPDIRIIWFAPREKDSRSHKPETETE